MVRALIGFLPQASGVACSGSVMVLVFCHAFSTSFAFRNKNKTNQISRRAGPAGENRQGDDKTCRLDEARAISWPSKETVRLGSA